MRAWRAYTALYLLIETRLQAFQFCCNRASDHHLRFLSRDVSRKVPGYLPFIIPVSDSGLASQRSTKGFMLKCYNTLYTFNNTVVQDVYFRFSGFERSGTNAPAPVTADKFPCLTSTSIVDFGSSSTVV